MQQFDYVVVGAGSAGCVLADRLSADGRHSVLVLEAGGSDRRLWVKIPVGYGRTFFDPSLNWKYRSEPDPELCGRAGYWPRGRVVGGSSSINALIYFRGLPSDFDDWQDAGNVGWGWDDVRPIFEQFEGRIDAAGRAVTGGALAVADVSAEAHPLKRHFFAAAAEIGLPFTEDFNGASPEGVGLYAITRRGGLRCSAADAFLRPALRRPNVSLQTEALVTKILLEDGRATGVRYERDGQTLTAFAQAAVIVSAGAVASPQLLQLSGIGPADLLRQHGIDVVVNHPAVGGWLQDHLAVTYHYKSREKTLNNELGPWSRKLLAGVRYAATRRGPLSLSVNQCGGFVRAGAASLRPDVQLYFNPLSYRTAAEGGRAVTRTDPFSGFIMSFQPSRPTSRGRIDIASPEPRMAPSIRPNSLSTQKDLDDVIAGGRLLQALAGSRAMQALIAESLAPSVQEMDDAALLADFRARSGTVYHPVGTCRMGVDPAESVVDPSLRVHGVAGLRVVDASVFPAVTSGNTNAPTIMVAHKGAAMILGDAAGGR